MKFFRLVSSFSVTMTVPWCWTRVCYIELSLITWRRGGLISLVLCCLLLMTKPTLVHYTEASRGPDGRRISLQELEQNFRDLTQWTIGEIRKRHQFSYEMNATLWMWYVMPRFWKSYIFSNNSINTGLRKFDTSYKRKCYNNKHFILAYNKPY